MTNGLSKLGELIQRINTGYFLVAMNKGFTNHSLSFLKSGLNSELNSYASFTLFPSSSTTIDKKTYVLTKKDIMLMSLTQGQAKLNSFKDDQEDFVLSYQNLSNFREIEQVKTRFQKIQSQVNLKPFQLVSTPGQLNSNCTQFQMELLLPCLGANLKQETYLALRNAIYHPDTLVNFFTFHITRNLNELSNESVKAFLKEEGLYDAIFRYYNKTITQESENIVKTFFANNLELYPLLRGDRIAWCFYVAQQKNHPKEKTQILDLYSEYLFNSIISPIITNKNPNFKMLVQCPDGGKYLKQELNGYSQDLNYFDRKPITE